MPDLISILPDSVANKIAAGEVVLRPASVVKELLENSVDAGSTRVQVYIGMGGKSMVQVCDNGAGMSETDARMCLERHATSKIRNADDLFNIRSFGFRGEALASIASVAQVIIKSRRESDEAGTEVTVDNSNVISQAPCSITAGTAITVKNLFYTIPARKKFLKNDMVEYRHIVEEFMRVALAHPEISFSLFHNGKNEYRLDKANIRQRIVAIAGNKINEKLVPVEEETQVVKVHGFVCKPEAARKTRGEQYFFVNNRFIRSPYLHHALHRAYENLIAPDVHLFYFIYLSVEPSSIDVNIHPTKTEIKFDNEQAIYAILAASVKRGLGKHNLVPSIDFNPENSFTPNPSIPQSLNPVINRSSNQPNTVGGGINPNEKTNIENWEKLFPEMNRKDNSISDRTPFSPEPNASSAPEIPLLHDDHKPAGFYRLHDRYILSQVKSGLLIIDRYRAVERILFERFMAGFKRPAGRSQQLVFPQAIDFTPSDLLAFNEISEEVRLLGFDINPIGKNSYSVCGIPSEMEIEDIKQVFDALLEQYRMNQKELKLERRENIARSLARKLSHRDSKTFSQEEMAALVDRLFGCSVPYYSPAGHPVMNIITIEELKRKFS